MQKDSTHRQQIGKIPVFALLFGAAVSLLGYVLFFQVNTLISKRALLQSVLVGVAAGLLCYFLLKQIYRSKTIRQLKPWHTSSLIIGLLIGITCAIGGNLPENLLFAPRSEIVLEIPAQSQGGEAVRLDYIHSGIDFVKLEDVALEQGAVLQDAHITLTPGQYTPAVLRWRGRSWQQVQFGFSAYQTGSAIFFRHGGKQDIFYFDQNGSNGQTTTFIQVDHFTMILALSRSVTYLSVFMIAYAIAFILLCFIGKTLVESYKKGYAALVHALVRLASWEKGRQWATRLLWAGVLLAGVWLLHYAWVLLNDPNPAEYREGANLVMTQYFLDGNNPFLLENQPLLNTNKGFLYNLAVLPLAALFGNTLFIHRLVVLIFNLLSTWLVYHTLKKSGATNPLALAGALMMLACLLFYVSPIARVDGLGNFLFLAACSVPWLHAFERKSLWASGLLGLLAFYTKPYFLLSVAIVAVYVFLFISKKKGLFYGGLTLLMVLASAVLVRQVFECYFLHTIFNSFSNASDSESLTWMLQQVGRFTLLFLPLGGLLGLLAIYRSNMMKTGRGESKKIGWLDLRHLDTGLIKGKMNYFLFFFIISTLVIILLLGKNHGNYMVYLFQLMAPPLIIFTLQQVRNTPSMSLASVIMVLTTMGILCFGLLYPNNARPYRENWDELNGYVEESQRILNSPLLVAEMLLEGMTPVDSGSSEYFYSTAPYADNYFAPAYGQVQEQGDRYLNEVRERVETRYYDHIIITEGYSPFCNTDIISQYYTLHDSVEVTLPQSNQHWVVQVWVPQP
ncbi:MAG: glycosyltransferase family 39 protein [Chloroflexi bacterium]|nr:glycosyltransferase family 39 protein [Chloroflexota bacterium]